MQRLFILLCVVPVISTGRASAFCGSSRASDAFSCQGEEIVASSLHCSGDHSCDSADITVNSSALFFNALFCSGSHSCVFANILADGTNTRVHCDGYYSCANVASLEIAGGLGLYANGALALFNASNVRITGTSVSSVSGYLGMSLASIHLSLDSDQSFRLTGYLTGYDAVISSNASTTNIEFRGPSSGFNTTVICNNGHICNIECRDNACDGLNLISQGGNFSITCLDGAFESDVCPKGLQMSAFMSEALENVPEFYNLYNLTSTSSTQTDVCNVNQSGAVLCNDYQECQDYDTRNTSQWSTVNTSLLCCTSERGCYSGVWGITNGETNFEGDIRCEGEASCSSAQLRSTKGDIFFTGDFSGARGNLKLQASMTSNIFVLGQSALTLGTINISSAHNFYCLAEESGNRITVDNINNNIYAYGYFALTESVVTNVNGHVYCQGTDACRVTSFDNVGGSILGQGYDVLAGDDYLGGHGIRNVAHTVAAFGYRAMHSAHINNVTTLYCQGPSCLASSIVNTVTNIVVSGTDALESASITSNLFGNRDIDPDNEQTFELDVYGTNSESYDVTCSSNDTCIISCHDENSCSSMNLNCFGTCFVYCEPPVHSTTCPIAALGNYTVLSFPSVAPSNIPSTIPTSLPKVSSNESDVATEDNSDNKNESKEEWWLYLVGVVVACVCLCIVVKTFLNYNRKRRYSLALVLPRKLSSEKNFRPGDPEVIQGERDGPLETSPPQQGEKGESPKRPRPQSIEMAEVAHEQQAEELYGKSARSDVTGGEITVKGIETSPADRGETLDDNQKSQADSLDIAYDEKTEELYRKSHAETTATAGDREVISSKQRVIEYLTPNLTTQGESHEP